jgi:hypothetical protein
LSDACSVNFVIDFGPTYHIEVEVGTDLGQLSLRAVDGVDIELGAQETELLSAPPAEADGVLDTELSQRLGNGEDTDSARAIIAAESLALESDEREPSMVKLT